MQESVSDCSQVPEFWKSDFLPLMSASAPAEAYFATSVLPSSMTSGGALPPKAVSSLVVTSDHCWIWTLTVTLGYLALKSALTPSTTACGALPFMSHTVSVPVWSFGLAAVEVDPHAAEMTAIAETIATINSFLGFIWVYSPSGFNSARLSPLRTLAAAARSRPLRLRCGVRSATRR